MKRCPLCEFAKVGDARRCPNCQAALTVWINFNEQARAAYGTGLHHLAQGDRSRAVEMLTQAAALDPEEPVYGEALGCALGQVGRYAEAAWMLERIHFLAPSERVAAARDKALALAQPSNEAGDGERKPLELAAPLTEEQGTMATPPTPPADPPTEPDHEDNPAVGA